MHHFSTSADVVHRRNQERVENHTKGAKTAHHITSTPNKICVTQPLRPNPKHFESVSSKHHGLHLELKKDTLGHLNGNDSYIDMHGMTENMPVPPTFRKTKGCKPLARVTPLTSAHRTDTKDFHLLTFAEVQTRLINCGMPRFAEFCFKEKIDGAFLAEMDEETFNSLKMENFQRIKLRRIISGWTPS